MGAAPVRIEAIGWRAHAALSEHRRPGSDERIVAVLSGSIYFTVAGELCWLGPAGAPLHPRAVVVAGALPRTAGLPPLDLGTVRPWCAVTPTPSDGNGVIVACRALRSAIAALGTPDGFGARLAGARLAFPFDRAAVAADALARACRRDDPGAAALAARPLLGLGPGLTPAGDDYVGGAFFARLFLARGDAGRTAAWRSAAADVRDAASERTHAISAALLGDMLAGDGHAALHDLASALGENASLPVVLEAGRRLTRIGHSSGWDMLAGFVGAIVGFA